MDELAKQHMQARQGDKKDVEYQVGGCRYGNGPTVICLW